MRKRKRERKGRRGKRKGGEEPVLPMKKWFSRQ